MGLFVYIGESILTWNKLHEQDLQQAAPEDNFEYEDFCR